ncbi:carboxylate-amine ligase YbdK [bacterium BMS3Abin07]|nr:carboxylate-amine ligase YbdK [bacterium BMS3Abin07]
MQEFNSSPLPTIGVELELQLIDAGTLDLTNIAETVLGQIHPSFEKRIKQEFIQSMIEINTGICSSVSEVENDLRATLEHLESILSFNNAVYLSSSLHPTARGRDQKIMNHPRYRRILDDLQLIGRRFISQGLHVHIGVDDPEKAVHICNTIRIFLPHLLALSTSSPFYEAELTGLMSYRTKLFEALPLAGMPDYLDGWEEFNHMADLLIRGGYIESVKDLWWDVRPHPEFGTVEVRVCDIPVKFRDILSITALIQALVVTVTGESTHPDPHMQILKANKWQAARYGFDGVFVDPVFGTRFGITDAITDLYRFVKPYAEMLGSVPYLDGIPDILKRKTGAHYQIEMYKKTEDFIKVIEKIRDGFFK